MARNVQAAIEAEANRKGLTGTRRDHYVGGAWNRIREGELGDDAERAALGHIGIAVDEVRRSKPRRLGERGRVVHFRSDGQWYELPSDEYRRLVREGRSAERDKRREAAEYERGERIYKRELARIEREDERERKRGERAAKHEERRKQSEEKLYMRLKRAEHSEVLKLIRANGGITRGITKATGREVERGEYNGLPSNVRHHKLSKRAGVGADQIAAQLHENMPWLGIETSRDLYDYFSDHAVRRMHGHAA